jgi:hypothetical protein
MDCADAWRYRDWVVSAFNRDLPYDRFLTDQVAGDLVPAPGGGFNRDGVVATGMLAIGNWGGGDADKEKLLTDIADDQLDVVARTFLGLTLACARCHDHKFDPLSQADYYGLAGIFFSTHILPNVGPKTNGPPMLRMPLAGPDDLARRQQYQKRLDDLENQVNETTARHYRAFAGSQRARTAEYLLAAYDYRRAGPAAGTPEDFARRRGLHPHALRRWLDATGPGAQYVVLNRPVRDVLGHPGVHGWRGEADCPSALVNTTAAEVPVLTFRLPPRSVAVHPGPSSGVVVAWRSPVAGTVCVRGRVADADPTCGDGIAWAVDLHSAGGARELASGRIANGAAQLLAQGKGATALTAVSVRPGDRVDLVVLPGENYFCDTTTVELHIALADGSKTWDLARDLRADPHQGNPHADSFGNRAVWSFLDTTRADHNQAVTLPGLQDWQRAVTEANAGHLDRRGLEDAAHHAQAAFRVDDARSPFWIQRKEDQSALPAAARAELAGLAAALEAHRKAAPPPPDYANGAQEGGVPGSPHAGVHDVRVHVRGRYDRLGEPVTRRFPEVLAGGRQKPITAGSGRLELARWIASPDNPLTARVMVNRIWQHHFGRGLVATPSNFGKLGRAPTHPDLLDWLAVRLVQSGWSVKHVHRLILLSATYRQSSQASPETITADPDNLLWGRAPRQRLEAEAIRDSILAVCGRLDPRPGGPATRDFVSPRRTLYLMTVRSDRTGFAPLFDVADSTAPVEERTVSTVAPQALFVLNHPFILEQTRLLAARVLAAGRTDAERIDRAYRLLYGRPPLPEELRLGLEYLAAGASAGRAWEEYCQVLLCANEFIYVD